MANTLRFKRGLVSGIPTAALGEPLFTTDTFDLYIGNGTTNTRFQKYIASGATTQIIRGDGSLYTFPLAISSPSAGQVLKYNGTSWVNDSDAGITGSGTTNYLPKFTGASTLGNSNLINDATGNLGLGITPSAWNTDYRVIQLGANASIAGRVGASNTFDLNTNAFRNATTGNWIYMADGGALRYTIDGGFGHYWYSAISGTAGGTITWNERARLTTSGNFIINNASTDNGLRFQVTGDGYFSGSVGIGTSSPASNIDILGSSSRLRLDGGSASFQILSRNTANTSTNPLIFDADTYTYNRGGVTRMTLDASGNLGLGVTPSAWSVKAFQVNGTSLFQYGTNNSAFGSNVYYDGANKYIASSTASLYQQATGQHIWYTAPSGTAGNAITFTQAMTLDASGRLGIGTSNPALSNLVISPLSANGTVEGINIIYHPDGASNRWRSKLWINDFNGQLDLKNSGDTQTIKIAANGASYFNGGNLLVGTTTDAGFRLDVNGTMRVSGASTFGGKMLLSTTLNYGLEVYNNTSADSRLNLTNSTTGTGADKGTMVGAIGTTAYLYNYQNGSLILGTNGTDRLTIASTGAATFSSSVTATIGGFSNYISIGGTSGLNIYGTINVPTGERMFLNSYHGLELRTSGGVGSGTPITVFSVSSAGAATFSSSVTAGGTMTSTGILQNAISNSPYTNSAWVRGASGVGIFLVNEALTRWIGIKTDNTLDFQGAANFSSSIQASTAISIGTTPDTNKPFKILKNINGTVGINFENTSTGSSAFSAIQMGTDVTGGTKFTNLVYASSGVTASGVYNPDGTSLINNGNGGLNFLGNPIRMYTGGSNGVLRLYFDNEGTTQLNATSPTTSITDGYRQYSADVVAGNAAPHFRTENGAIIKLYQETTAVGNAIFSQGGGNSVLDDSTFDGYTLRQIVKALRNQGILA